MAALLVDEGIGRNLVQQLRAQGCGAIHVLDVLPKGARDGLVFREAQHRGLTVFTWNHKHFALLAEAWRDWGRGDHQGLITRPIGRHQLPATQTLQVLARYCADPSSFVNRIELF
jgi:hypothetical protein